MSDTTTSTLDREIAEIRKKIEANQKAADRSTTLAKCIFGVSLLLLIASIYVFIREYYCQPETPTPTTSNVFDNLKIIADGATSKNLIDYLSAFGDYSAGSVLGLWSLAGLAFVYATFLEQRNAIHYTEINLKEAEKNSQEQSKTIVQQTEALKNISEVIIKQNSVLNEQKDELSKQVNALHSVAQVLTQQNDVLAEHKKELAGQNIHLFQQTQTMVDIAKVLQELVKNAEETNLRRREEEAKKRKEQFEEQLEKLMRGYLVSERFSSKEQYIRMLKNDIWAKVEEGFKRKEFKEDIFWNDIEDILKKMKIEQISTYFTSNLNQILELIDNHLKNVPIEEKLFYQNLIDKHLCNREELVLIYFFGLFDETSKQIIERWKLLKNIHWDSFNFSSPLNAKLQNKESFFKKRYAPSAFGESE